MNPTANPKDVTDMQDALRLMSHNASLLFPELFPEIPSYCTPPDLVSMALIRVGTAFSKCIESDAKLDQLEAKLAAHVVLNEKLRAMLDCNCSTLPCIHWKGLIEHSEACRRLTEEK